jgi:dTDP-4-amino-4,6-dideoxygalactose transaminase
MPEQYKIIEYESLGQSNAHFMSELVQAASKVIYSGWYVLGYEVNAFEQEFAQYLGAKHCIGVANGLDALILSIEALGLPKASDILVASNTYIATILAIIRSGHRPVLVEPDIATFNINPDLMSSAITNNTKALCITHLFGKSCKMDAIVAFAKKNRLMLIEDCAQSHGAKFNGKMTGTFGDAGCFSFYPTKNLGAFGDGGAIVTNDDELADRLKYLRNYGSKQKYFNQYIGFNSRLDEMQAALLRIKLKYLDQMNEHKRKLANIYFSQLSDAVVKPRVSDDEYDVFHIYGIRHSARDRLKAQLLECGIKTEIHYPIPPHQQEAMKDILIGSYEVAEELHLSELSLPISFGHTEQDIEYVCQAINNLA